MNIVFLDIDGVLNSQAYFNNLIHLGTVDDCFHDEIDESKLPLLKQIVNENNAKIVLSSTWRELDQPNDDSVYSMWLYLINTLAKVGLEIYDKTPQIGMKRTKEIKKWLEKHDDVKAWISLDDDCWEEDYEEIGLGGHLVHTVFFGHDINKGGLQKEHVILAKQLFDRQKGDIT